MSISRRQMLSGLALGAAAGAGAVVVGACSQDPTTTPDPNVGAAVPHPLEPFFGIHQSGVATPGQAHALFVAYDLKPDVSRDGLARLMKILSDDAARMTQGAPALADLEPELSAAASRLTITFGFGPGLFAQGGLAMPSGLAPIPALKIDKLEERWSDGDLLIQICGDDPTVVSHAHRMLFKDTRAFATVRWQQRGFLRSQGSFEPRSSPRNLMGQVDGTVNPDTAGLEARVWIPGGGAMAGGTFAVIRRIRMDLDKWDLLGRGEREQVIGRNLDNGAPLTGIHERDVPDLNAKNEHGLYLIPEFAHVRRAHAGPEAPFLRRGYNYDEGVLADGQTDAGLIFCAYTNDIEGRFMPVQRSLAEMDLLNLWTTPIGSAVFAILPGTSEGGWVGETLLA